MTGRPLGLSNLSGDPYARFTQNAGAHLIVNWQFTGHFNRNSQRKGYRVINGRTAIFLPLYLERD